MAITQQTTDFLAQRLAVALQRPVHSLHLRPIGGGSINDTYQLTVNGNEYFFLKRNDAGRYPGLFEKERNGLLCLAAQDCIRTPSVLCCETYHKYQLLVLEWIASAPASPGFWASFGEQLARLHRCSQDQFGFTENNYMGALSQINTPHANWINFFITCRLQPQVELAAQKKLLTTSQTDLFERLYDKLDNFFNPEPPSLLHGDLWSGNYLCSHRFQPVLIDPAVYYGHRSMDLAMTTLFGGFDRSFYEAYAYHFPLPSNYREQWELCNLYPLLIHLNLFGASYRSSITGIVEKYS